MEEFCKFCGTPLEDGVCPNGHNFKKMCINCADCGVDADGKFVCKNEDNLKTAFEKIMEAASGVTEAYVVKNLEILPVPLKKPTLKCGKWTLNDGIKKELETLFK